MQAPVLNSAALSRYEYARRYFIDPLDPFGSQRDFLSYCHLQDASSLDPTESGVRVFERWPHIVEVALALQAPILLAREGKAVPKEERFLAIGKSRRRGISWIVAAFEAWRACMHEGFSGLIYTIGEVQSADFLSKVSFIHEHMPPEWKLPSIKDRDSKQEFALENTRARLLALPSSSGAGRGFDASLIVFDEADHHVDTIVQNYLTALPIVEAGGQLVVISTINKQASVSLFRSIYMKAGFAGTTSNGFRKLFIPFGSRAGEDNEEWERRRRSVPDEELAALGLTRDLYMEQENPRTEEEMLSAPKSISYFDAQVLQQMLVHCHSPIRELDPDDEFAQLKNYYSKRAANGKYVAGTDVAHGTGGDYSVTVVLDVPSGRVVADIMSNQLPPERFAEASVQLLRKYNAPHWGIEDNDWGIEVIKTAERMGYRNLFHRQTGNVLGGTQGLRRDAGWHTDQKSRWVLWGELREEIDRGGIIIPNREGLGQFFDVITDREHDSRPAARTGAHDDYPVALGIAWQMRKFARNAVNKSAAPKALFSLGAR